jgi:hypothetical protein
MAGVTLVAAACQAKRENPVLTGLAAFTLSKAVSREKVGSGVREACERQPLLRELVGCPRCLGAWTALGLVLLPKRQRQGVLTVMAAAAVNDFLHAAFAVLRKHS